MHRSLVQLGKVKSLDNIDITPYYRDTWVEVDLDAIEANICAIKENFKRDIHVIAVVKADGYGHGAVQVAKAALRAKVTYLAVAILDEAIYLRKEGITAPILVLGYCKPEYVPYALKYNITLTVFQSDWLKKAKSYMDDKDKLNIHLKYDTGMGRIGITTEEEGNALIEEIKSTSLFHVEGIFTHFATADEINTDYFNKQYSRFLEVLKQLEEHGINPVYIHCGNSATGMRFPDQSFNMFRLGISMYGLTPSIEIKSILPVELKEAFSLKTKIIQVKQVPAGEGISYGATYVTSEPEWIATLPIGYADGWYRYHSSTGGYVLVNGKKAPFVGRICMDQCMIKLPEKVEEGTTVTLIGKDQGESISVDDIAQRLSTINYEIPCMINHRVPRIYYQKMEKIFVRNLLHHEI